MKRGRKIQISFAAAAIALSIFGMIQAGAAEISSEGTADDVFWAMNDDGTAPSDSASALVNCDFTHKAVFIKDEKSAVYTVDFGKVNNIAQGGNTHPVFEKTFKIKRGGNSNFDTLAFYNGLDRKENGYDGTVCMTVTPGIDGPGLYKVHILGAAAVGTDAVFRAKRFAVNNVTAGVQTNTSYGSEWQYNAAKDQQTLEKQIRIFEGIVQLQEGENLLEIYAPQGENAPEFIAAGFERLTPASVGNPVWMNYIGCGDIMDYHKTVSNGSDKASKRNLGTVINFDENTIGKFGLTDGAALKDQVCLPGFSEGSLEAYIDVEEAGLYDVNILAPVITESNAGRSFQVIPNDDQALAAATQATIYDASDAQVVSSAFSLNYLTASVQLNAGVNKITLIGNTDEGAPGFYGLCITKCETQPIPKVDAVMIGAYKGDLVSEGDNMGTDTATLFTAEFSSLPDGQGVYSGITWDVTHYDKNKTFETFFKDPITIEGGASVKAALGIQGLYGEKGMTAATAQLNGEGGI